MKTANILQKIHKVLNQGVSLTFKNSKSIGVLFKNIASTFGLRLHGSWNSHYSEIYDLPNGQTLQIRLSDHPTNDEIIIYHDAANRTLSLIMGNKADEIEIKEERCTSN